MSQRGIDSNYFAGESMKRLATRVYTFQELMNRIDMEYWYVHHHGQEQYTFVPVQYRGK